MTISSRAKHLSAGLAFLLSSTMLSGIAHAQDAAKPDAADATEIVIVGKGQTRSVTTLVPGNLDLLPPGTSIQKALNTLPGVMAQSIDALGVNEQSLSLQVRGFNTTHLGYSLDGMPLGDGAYNNYNGLTISRALISENLGRADLATGIAGLSIPSTSNLGGALIYTSSNPKKDFGASISQTIGDEKSARTFLRVDTGEHAGFSAYVSGAYSQQDLFVNQGDFKTSTGKQFNAKGQYKFSRGTLTAFADISQTNQADDPYLSKDMLSRLGPDWGGYAPDWTSYLGVASCGVTSLVSKCVNAPAPQKNADVTFTNGQILRNDNLYYIAGDFDVTNNLKAHLQVYKHTDKGAGNNFITGLSNQGTTSTTDDLPVTIRDTRYTIDRDGVVGSMAWTAGVHHIEAGFWVESNTSSAARYIWTNVKAPFSLSHFMDVDGQPDTAQWVQETKWKTTQFYVQDEVKLLDDALSIDFGFKSTNAKSAATALPGIAKVALLPTTSTQFATGSLEAKDNFLPEVGARWTIAPGHEIYASYSENIAMFQGGFKLGPQSVSQTIWDQQGKFLKPETSKSLDLGYRYVSRPLQVSVAAYHVDFDNRLLQYNPCATKDQANPGCGNSFHNAGSVTSQGVELGVLWKPLNWLSWYNSASLNETTYNEDLVWSLGTTTAVLPTAGKQQVDTPKQMFASTLNLKHNGFWGTLSGKYTGKRFYTYTNDQSFPGVTTFDLGLGYTFSQTSVLKGAKLALNITNLTNKRYASNFDNSVFAPSDSGVTANGDSNAVAGDVLVFHTSAPRQAFLTLSYGF
jgi:iron complex outermembrane receptor protein